MTELLFEAPPTEAFLMGPGARRRTRTYDQRRRSLMSVARSRAAHDYNTVTWWLEKGESLHDADRLEAVGAGGQQRVVEDVDFIGLGWPTVETEWVDERWDDECNGGYDEAYGPPEPRVNRLTAERDYDFDLDVVLIRVGAGQQAAWNARMNHTPVLQGSGSHDVETAKAAGRVGGKAAAEEAALRKLADVSVVIHPYAVVDDDGQVMAVRQGNGTLRLCTYRSEHGARVAAGRWRGTPVHRVTGRKLDGTEGPTVKPPRGAKRKRKRTPIELPGGREHGTTSGYQAGCGCDPCFEANRKTQAVYGRLRKERRAKADRDREARRSSERDDHEFTLDGRKVNAFQAACGECGLQVPAHAGRLAGYKGGRWVVVHNTPADCWARMAESAAPVPVPASAAPADPGFIDWTLLYEKDEPT